MTLRIAVVAGAAVGVISALYFLSLVVGAGPWVPLVISVAICAALAWWFRLPAQGPADRPATGWLASVFLGVLAVSIAVFILLSIKQPHGDWDAWAIWNLHARFLERGGAQWAALFSKQLNWSHPDYPLMIPAFIAQIWSVVRSESTVVPTALSFLFTFGTVAVVVGGLQRLRGWDQALVAGTFLLGSADLIGQGAMQYADIPLAFYIVSALALLSIDDMKCTVMAGAIAGFAAWTKNEGIVFVLALVAARCLARWRFGTMAGMRRELTLLGIGAAPVLAVVALFKLRYAPPDELVFNHRFGELMGRALDFGRYVGVLEGFVKAAFQLGMFIVPGVLVLAAYAWLAGFKVEPERRATVATMAAALLLMLIGDFFVYVLLPNDLSWQIGTSLDRVLMQIFPATVLLVFAATSTVELKTTPPEHKGTKKEVRKASATRHR